MADYFRKRHADVLRAIDNLDCSPAFNERNFASVDYLDGKGEERRSFDMTRDGWVFLAMGFTGPRAAQFKEAYIARFNEMEETLRNAHRTAYLGQVVVKEFALTMSSREIAELTGKRHNNVRADIEKIGAELSLTFQQKLEASDGGRPSKVFFLPKRETLILVSGYSVELRARIIDRWMDETLSPNWMLLTVGRRRPSSR